MGADQAGSFPLSIRFTDWDASTVSPPLRLLFSDIDSFVLLFSSKFIASSCFFSPSCCVSGGLEDEKCECKFFLLQLWSVLLSVEGLALEVAESSCTAMIRF